MALLRRLTATMTTLAILAACTPSPTSVVTSAPVVVSASPTYLCTPTPSATPAACDKAAYDKEQQQRTLEAEAIAVYQRYWKEYTRLLEAGGATEATPELKQTITDPALANVISLLKYQKERGWVPKPFQAKLSLQVRSTALRQDAVITLIACEDTSGSVLIDPAGTKAGQGGLAVQFTALKRIDGVLKIYDGEGQPRGTTCPIG